MNLSVEEAQLIRLLGTVFGAEQVVPHMRVVAVCGGELAASLADTQGTLRRWAEEHRCLCTVVDADGEPKLVVELFSGFADSVTALEAEHQRFLPTILDAHEIRYLTLHPEELRFLIDSGSSTEVIEFISDRLGLPLESEAAS